MEMVRVVTIVMAKAKVMAIAIVVAWWVVDIVLAVVKKMSVLFSKIVKVKISYFQFFLK